MVAAWRPLKIGAGGQLTGIDIAADGTKVVRTDTYGAYVWNGIQWDQLITKARIPADVFGFEPTVGGSYNPGNGVFEICIAPSNTSRIYMMWSGMMFRSDDRGGTFTHCAGWTRISSDVGIHGYNRKMAVDPVNADVVYIGTVFNGVFVTTNGGTTFSTVGGIAASSSNNAYLVAFDPASAVSGSPSRTQGIYISSFGTGVYHSTNASTFTLTTGTPTTHNHMIVAPTGVVWLTTHDGSADNLYKYTGSWSHVNVSVGAALQPLAAVGSSIVIAMNEGGGIYYSNDAGATFLAKGMHRVATDIPWLQYTNESYMTAAHIVWDPSTSRLYFAEGIGVWYTTDPSAADITWTSQSVGIEQLVGTHMCTPPNGGVIVCAWDRPVFRTANFNAFPSFQGPDLNVTQSINMGWHVDYSPTDSNFIVGIFNWFGIEKSGYSTDNGVTWTSFATYPPLMSGDHISGSIAAGSNTNFVWIGCNTDPSRAYYTKNGGTTWTAVTGMAGVPTTGEVGWGNSYLAHSAVVCADRVNPNTFYAHNIGTAADASWAGVWRSTDSGDTWTRVRTTRLSTYGEGSPRLRAVPGKAGHLFYYRGLKNGEISGGLMRSMDGGVNWVTLPNVVMVWGVGFGKPQSVGGYPALFIAAWVDGGSGSTYGFYRSDNGDQATPTWTSIGDGYPTGSNDFIRWIDGDPNVFGRCFVSFEGSGFAYYGEASMQSGLRFGLHAETVAFSGLLDVLGVSATRAYSTRRLASAYAGSAIRIRRSSDNAEQDIGFVGENLDTASIATFVGANSAYVVKMYDQSGTADDLVQATVARQPRIVNAGTLDTRNSKAAPFYDGDTAPPDVLSTGTTTYTVQTVGAVAAYNEAGPNFSEYDGVVTSVTGPTYFILGTAGSPGVFSQMSNIVVNNSGANGTFGGTLMQINVSNPAIAFSITSEGVQLGRDRLSDGRGWPGWIGEVVMFSTDLSAGNDTAMYTNQKTYWGTP